MTVSKAEVVVETEETSTTTGDGVDPSTGVEQYDVGVGTSDNVREAQAVSLVAEDVVHEPAKEMVDTQLPEVGAYRMESAVNVTCTDIILDWHRRR